jgi:D-psicose/D-tagatose/L-ribulose 3-epimerase
MKFGANTFIWTSPFASARDLALIPKVKAMGFDVFEIAVEDPALVDIPVVKVALAENGLDVIVCGVFGPDRDLSSADATVRDNARQYLRWCIDAAQALGSPLVCGPMYASVGKTHPESEDEIRAERERSIRGLREMAAYTGDRGIRLAIEPLNRFENDLINTTAQALEYLDEVGSPYAGVHLDSFHMHLEEKDSAAAIRLAGQRLYHIHACENDRGIPGSGQVAWSGIFGALKGIGYDGAITIESFTPENKSIARAVCIWRQIAPDQDSIARDGLAFLRRQWNN